jgi:phosphohistidine phosphatase
MRLLVVRHAIAVPHGTPEVPEDERPLTARGEKRFRVAARGLARICRRPDVLLSSPLVRARQTADIAAEAWGKVEVTETDALAGGSFEQIAAAVEKYADQKLVAAFGHEPDVSMVVARLLGTSDSERLTFKKGAAALLDVPGRMADGGALVWYVPPRVLRAVAGDDDGDD